MDGAVVLGVILLVSFLVLVMVALVGVLASVRNVANKVASAADDDEPVVYAEGRTGIVGDINRANISHYLYDLEQQSAIDALKSDLQAVRSALPAASNLSRFEERDEATHPPAAYEADSAFGGAPLMALGAAPIVDGLAGGLVPAQDAHDLAAAQPQVARHGVAVQDDR